MSSVADEVPFQLNLDNWKDHPDILTDSLWNLGARAKGGHRSGHYHGNFVPQIPDQFIRRFTKPGDLVLDMFAGSGTTLIESIRLGRSCLGMELCPDVRVETINRLIAIPNPYEAGWAVVGVNSAVSGVSNGTRTTASDFARQNGKDGFSLTFLHPPYWNIIKFSDSKRCLSRAKTLPEFCQNMTDVAANAFDVSTVGGHLVLVIADICHKGKFIPLGSRAMDAIEAAGWELRGIVVKDMQGNERGAGRTANLWRYRSLKNGTFVFAHEYVMLFRAVKGNGRGLPTAP